MKSIDDMKIDYYNERFKIDEVEKDKRQKEAMNNGTKVIIDLK